MNYKIIRGIVIAWFKKIVANKSTLYSNNETIGGKIYGNMGNGAFKNMVGDLNNYFSNHPVESEKYKDELDFINTKINSITLEERILYTIIPYPFILQYNYNKINVHKDEAAGMFYVYLDGKKLYYHKGFKNALDVQKSFTYISVEQNADSPHRYLDHFFNVNYSDVVVDLGAAEGNFSLMVVDKVKELIIVEADQLWMEALYKTFEPWKEKVTIINKFIGNKNDEYTVTLDKLQGQNKITALKMDIEGAEISVLENAIPIIRSNDIKMAITTYHRQTDADDIKNILERNDYQTVFSKGYMLFIFSKLEPPYFRQGIIKAFKNKIS